MATFVGIFFLINFVIIIVAFMTLLERRLLGRIQNRIGPNRTGPNGLLQPFADVTKLLTKEGKKWFRTPAKVEKDNKVAVFHGSPNPMECADKFVEDNWR